MKKRFAILFAALSMCACSFMACDSDDDNNDKGNNTTTDKLADGKACTKDAECASNLCKDKVCTAKPSEPGASDKLEVGKECDGDDKCASGWCKKESDAAHAMSKCAALLGANEVCDGNETRCDSSKNLTCEPVEGAPGVNRMCKAATVGNVEVGGECKSSAECKNSICKKANDTDEKGVCTAVDDVPVEIGGECKINAECKDSFCKKANKTDEKGICTALLDKNAECSEAAQCKDGFCNKVNNNEKGTCSDKELLEDNAECTDAAQCKGGFCVKANQNDEKGKCASSQDPNLKAIGIACNEDKECESNYCAGEGMERACANVLCKKFTPSCDNEKNVANKSCDLTSGLVISESCQAPQVCKQNKVDGSVSCADDTNPDCSLHSDCAGNATAKLCDAISGKCVESLEDVYCNDTNCPASKGECIKGLCIPAAQKAMAESAACDSSFIDYCDGDTLVYCTGTAVEKINCADSANNAGRCVVAIDPAGNNPNNLVADCSGSDDMIQRCAGKGSANLCYANENWFSRFYCASDLEGKDIALPDYKSVKNKCPNDTPVCSYNDNGPVCVAQ